MIAAAPGTLRSIRRQLAASLAAAVALVGGVGGWASTAELAGAVIAPGTLVVDSDVKKVQHPVGGVIGELRVREGDEVKAGVILARLDETITRANLAIIVQNLDELAARQARLEAERDGEEEVSPPADLSARASQPAVGRLLAGERRLFEVRRAARLGQKAQLDERIGQLREQIQGMIEQVAANDREIELIADELEGVRDLRRKNLVPVTRMNALEREAARLRGERGSLVSSIAQAKGRISETTLQILQIDQDLRSEVSKDLAEIQAKVSELNERRNTAEDQLNHIDIRAPQDGRVHQLAVHTVGGVISAGEPIMLIVPGADRLVAEVRIAPHDIDQVRVGQMALLRFPAFNLRTTPDLNGEVIRVAADITQDQKTSAAFYTVRVGLSDDEVARLNGLKLVPGMPLEVFIQTGERTVMSYLLKPVSDQIAKAWRER
jgi:HlyD family secretion protein